MHECSCEHDREFYARTSVATVLWRSATLKVRSSQERGAAPDIAGSAIPRDPRAASGSQLAHAETDGSLEFLQACYI